jgi:hypothetical protein
MSLGYNPVIKFQPDLETRLGLERLANAHHIGGNGSSANEVMKLFAPQIAKIAEDQLWIAMAELSKFHKRKFSKGPKRPAPDLL